MRWTSLRRWPIGWEYGASKLSWKTSPSRYVCLMSAAAGVPSKRSLRALCPPRRVHLQARCCKQHPS